MLYHKSWICLDPVFYVIRLNIYKILDERLAANGTTSGSRHGGLKMVGKFHEFLRNESGATAIEYGLIASLIAVVIIGAATTLGTKISNTFGRVSNQLR